MIGLFFETVMIWMMKLVCKVMAIAGDFFLIIFNLMAAVVPDIDYDFDVLAEIIPVLTAFVPVEQHLAIYSTYIAYRTGAFIVRTVLRLIPTVNLGE